MRIIILSITFVLISLSVSSKILETFSKKSIETTCSRIIIYQSYEDSLVLNNRKQNSIQSNQIKFIRLEDNIFRTHFILNNEIYVKFNKKTLKSERIKDIIFDAYYDVYEQIVLSKLYNLQSEENFRVLQKIDKLQSKMKLLANQNTLRLEKRLKGIHDYDKILKIFGI